MTEQHSYRWVDTDEQLTAVIDAVLDEPRYAIDTEFHREKTYYPALALVQIAWPENLVLIDPLAVDIKLLLRLFESQVEAVFHAAQQDLDVLTHAVGGVPRVFFDTQIAGGFVGYGTPSLVSLLEAEVGVRPPKGDRLTDWLRRPLTDAQKNYAASDVAYLLEVADNLTAKLTELDRVEWAQAAFQELAERPVSGTRPEDAWMRLKDTRGLRPRPRAIAQAVAAWRETEAIRRDVPVRHVIPDLAVLGISQRMPKNAKELNQARGVDDRVTRKGVAEAVLAAVEEGLHGQPPPKPRGKDDLDRKLRPAVTLISAWISQVAKREKIDTAMLATKNDLIEFLVGAEEARLAHGWRNELLGTGIARLLSGSAGLTFDGEGALHLVNVTLDDDASY